MFIHMDRKNKEYNEKKVEEVVRFSGVFHTERTSVAWGGYSLVNAELLLLKAALKGEYSYYHLLSGEDLPLKNQDEIHKFFDANQGKEFVRFENEVFGHYDRVRYWYFFQDKLGRRRDRKVLRIINRAVLVAQKILGIRRNKKIRFQKGTEWFSITDGLARYVAAQEEWIKKVFAHTLCADEVFLQTIIHNSDFQNALYHKQYDNDLHAIMRLIDWTRGDPYVFRYSDRRELVESDMLFARKFDCNVDREIIDCITTAIGC